MTTQTRVQPRRPRAAAGILMCVLVLSLLAPAALSAQGIDAGPPDQTVKLVFIHHSCGENWLKDEDGGLGRALGENHYFVSDTNYGWGPDGIGDRTDIVDWPEWFTGPESGRILAALYTESGQLSNYTRPLPDPGGENEVILFKSCFPNSMIEGSPGDPPARGEGLTVGNAKAIYQELLATFATRPDKLFVAISAPPVQDPAYAANARAFNSWLVTEWLAGYSGSNVAVWDFYNVLTHPDNHHRVREGAVEYVTSHGGDTTYYPTDGDDHPNSTGNRKATVEFVPVLNVFYHRWQSGRPAVPPAGTAQTPAVPEPAAQPTPLPETEAEPPTEEAPGGAPPQPGGTLLDFEAEAGEWTAFTDGEGGTALTCGREEGEAYSGAAALHIEYAVAAGGWANCSLIYDEPADWHGSAGLALYLRAEAAGTPVTLVAYGGTEPDALKPFEVPVITNQEAVSGWQRVDVAWDSFRAPEWEGDPGARLDPGQVMGIAVAFAPGSRGWLRVDDVVFLSTAPSSPAAEPSSSTTPAATQAEPVETSPAPTQAPAPSATSVPPAPTPASEGGRQVCGVPLLVGLMALAPAAWRRAARRKRNG